MTHKRLFLGMAIFDVVFIYAAASVFFYFTRGPGWLDVPFARMMLHAAIVSLFFPVLGLYFGLYRDRWYFYVLDDVGLVFKTVTLGSLFALAYLAFFGFTPRPFYVLLFYVTVFCVYLTARYVFGVVIRWFTKRGYGLRPVAIVGSGRPARVFYDRVLSDPYVGYRLVGFISAGEENPEVDPSRILGPIEDTRSIVLKNDIAELVITHSPNPEDRVRSVLNHCVGLDIAVRIVPDLVDIVSRRVQTVHLEYVPLVDVVSQPLFGWYFFVKRVFDVGYALAGIAAATPLFLLLYPFVRYQSGASFLYKQERIGRDGKPYVMYKIRSMVADAETQTGPVWAGKDDPRVTPVGRFIRRFRIDELPQLINVLRGEMSVIGPRPERRTFVEEFSRSIPLYKRRLAVKPGITGLAQVKHKYDETLDDVREKLKYDLYYIDHMTLGLDLKIYLWTMFVILTGKGAK